MSLPNYDKSDAINAVLAVLELRRPEDYLYSDDVVTITRNGVSKHFVVNRDMSDPMGYWVEK